MVVLEKVSGFTLIESLVSGVLISIVSGLAILIYLNMAASLERTSDILIRQKARLQMDSLMMIPGATYMEYEFNQDLSVKYEKNLHDGKASLYKVSYDLLDSMEVSQLTLLRLVYE